MGHLRSHNCQISQLDYSKISVNPLSIEMIQGGAVSTSFKECPTNSTLPYKDCILPQSTREVVEASKQFSKSSSSNNKALTSCSQNISSTQNAAVATSQPTNNKSPISLLLSKTKRDSLTCTSSTREVSLVVPASLPKNPALPPVNGLRTYSKDPPAQSTKAVPKKLVLVLDKLNKPLNLNQNAKINLLPPNELFSVSESMIVDANTTEEPKESLEEDIMNIESVPVGSGITSLNTKSINTSNNTKCAALPAKPVPAKSAPGKPLKKLCAECGISCLNISRHLNGSGRPTNPNLTCEVCELILPTKCALKCHIRIHDELPPYKCPDCGKDFTNWDDLLSHLKMSCGHIAKCVRYYCHSCKKHFASKSILANHITDLHSRDIFRCSSCPVAFYNKTSLDNHMITTVHKEETVFLNQKQCNLCPTKLMPVEEFESHIRYHTNNSSAMIYGYRCPWCSMVYVNKMAFIIHQVEEKKEIENSNNTLLKKKFIKFLSQDTEPNDQESNKKENSHSDFEFVEQFPNLEPNLPAAERDPLSSDDWEFLQDQRVKGKIEEVCIVCKKRSVLLLPGINTNKQSLCCKQCSKTLDAQSMIQNGQAEINNFMNKKFNVSSNMDYEVTKDILKSNSARVKKRSNSVEKTQTKSKKPRKSGVSPKQANSYKESNMDLDSDLHLPVKKKVPRKFPDKKIDFGGQSVHVQGQVVAFQSPNELVCAKCKFVADTKETFLEHITVHRMDPNTYQCLECGLCFVVLPSLDRHLRMYHGIQDVNEYTDKNKSSLPKKMHVEETQCLQENQCRVCLETYDSNSSLEKHFRTHGMAFMTSLSKSP